jgi:hypothetical protein
LPVDVVLDELAAVDVAVTTAHAGDVVVMFVDDVDRVVERLGNHGAQAVTEFAALVPPQEGAAQPAA